MDEDKQIVAGFGPADLLSSDLTYEQAVRRLVADGRVTYLLRQRIREDAEREPLKALQEAQVLVALAKLRLGEQKTNTGEQQ